jgi:hypothetical protein
MAAGKCWRRTLCAFAIALWAAGAGAQTRLPIFDAHMHYNEDAWTAQTPSKVLAAMAAAGVARALVSSTPDDGTLRLVTAAPRRFAAELRPYRGDVGSHNWFADPETPKYLAARLKQSPYVGIGEVHLASADQLTPTMLDTAKLALERGLFVHIHADAAPVEALLKAVPRLEVVWAHAGLSTPPAEVGRLMDAHQNLWAELSFRAEDIMPGGALDDAWQVLLIRHAQRFMIGSDTYVNERWAEYPALIEAHRRWLAKLPPGVAAAIAWRNAVGLFGDGGLLELAK